MGKKPYPKFANEQAELTWLAEQGRGVDAHMSPVAPGEAEAVGLGFEPGGPMPRKPITIRLPLDDIALAKALARRMGMPYQTLIGQILRAGLRFQEAELAASTGDATEAGAELGSLFESQAALRQEVDEIRRILRDAGLAG